jgi:probable rRNA maturation factor
MIDFENKTNYNFNISQLENIYTYLTDKNIELILTTNEEIKQINKIYRNINKATDVLSFPLEDMPKMPLGSIIISLDMAKEAALTYGHSIDDEIKILFIHGLLHLLGYDHEIDNGEMRKKEEELIEKFNLPQSLIIRNN